MCKNLKIFSRGLSSGVVRPLVCVLLLLLLASPSWGADWVFLKDGAKTSESQQPELGKSLQAPQVSQVASQPSQTRSMNSKEQQKKALENSLTALEQELNNSKLVTNELKKSFSTYVTQSEALKKTEEIEDKVHAETLNQLAQVESTNAVLADENAVLKDKVKKYDGFRRRIGVGASLMHIDDKLRYSADANLGFRYKKFTFDIGAKYILKDNAFSLNGIKNKNNYIFSTGIGFEF